jgi:hypothetical protein
MLDAGFSTLRVAKEAASMKKTLAIACALGMLAAGSTRAAPPEYLVVDHSSELLMDSATARALWQQSLPPAV